MDIKSKVGGYTAEAAHLYNKRCVASLGMEVAAGELIAKIDTSGTPTTHLHYAVFDDSCFEGWSADMVKMDDVVLEPHICFGSKNVPPAPPPSVPMIDTDGDGKQDFEDNCPYVSNPTQANADGDKRGDVCDCDLVTCLDVPLVTGKCKGAAVLELATMGFDGLLATIYEFPFPVPCGCGAAGFVLAQLPESSPQPTTSKIKLYVGTCP